MPLSSTSPRISPPRAGNSARFSLKASRAAVARSGPRHSVRMVRTDALTRSQGQVSSVTWLEMGSRAVFSSLLTASFASGSAPG